MTSWIEKEMEEYEMNYGWATKAEMEETFRKLYEIAVSYMDDEIREELHAEYCGEVTDMEFLRLYEEKHFEKYGEEFEI